jgi:predicted dehydrogenase
VTVNQIKIGVVGAGYWGPNLIRNFIEIPEAELSIVVDKKQERCDHIKNRYPTVYTTRDFRELQASDVEAVVIATPVYTHYSLAMECLQSGKHVLIEKPITCSIDEARALLQMGEQTGLTVMVGHTFLYNPAVNALKDIINSGEIGEVYYINGTRVNLGLYHPDINVIWDLAPHDVSILIYLLGSLPEYTSARGGMFVKAGQHDVAYITLYYPDGLLADLRVSWLDPCKIRSLTIVGSKKMLVYDDIEPVNKVMIYDKGVEVQAYTDTYEDFHLAYRYGEAKPFPLDWEEPLKAECKHFLSCIRNGTKPLSDSMQGLQVVQILESAHHSLNNGHAKEPIPW